MSSLPSPRFRALGEHAWVLDFPGHPPTLPLQYLLWQVQAQLLDRRDTLDAMPGMASLTWVFDPDHLALPTAQALFMRLWQQASQRPPKRQDLAAGRLRDIPVHYGGEAGPDLADVARLHGLTPQAVVKLHSQAEYRVFFLGFLPGFAYLEGLPDALHTPRRSTPRTAVPAGAVGIGGRQTGIYPSASPGGWQLIGRTALPLFDPAREPAAWLQPGDRVRFVLERLDD